MRNQTLPAESRQRMLPRSVRKRGAKPMARLLGILLLTLQLWTPWLMAAVEESPAAISTSPNFQTHVLPLFQRHCLRCHDSTKRMMGLDLSTLEGVSQGSSSGPVVIPGRSEESRLYEVIVEGAMPLDKKTTPSAGELKIVREWIESSATSSAADLASAHTGAPITHHDIVPLILLHCTVCHGQRLQEGGLDLRTRASMLKGGKSGPALIPGDPEKSLMVQRIRSQEMPPPGREVEASVRRMSDSSLQRLIQWIAQGAPGADNDPEADPSPDLLVSGEDRQFWAFQSPRPLPVPEVGSASRVLNPIDAFVLHRLHQKGLDLAPEAERLTLIRRASFDLTGLPPEPEEVEHFLADPDERAYEALIDRLLSSPRYGERWGRAWLDVVGYADWPQAYRYRDYVVGSLNAGKPYDRFLLEQLAGDELVNLDEEPVVTPEIADNLVATGFLRMAQDKTGARLINFVPHRVQVITDEIKIFSTSILALTVGCARCHDHKFDPLPQRDYYRLAAMFKGAFDEHDWLPPDLQDDPDRPDRWQWAGDAQGFSPIGSVRVDPYRPWQIRFQFRPTGLAGLTHQRAPGRAPFL